MIIKIIILVTLGIIFVIGVHEAGHFMAARLFGVKVRRVSIGFGKVLWRWQGRHQTEYVFSLLPLGGYVSLLDDRIEKVSASERQYAFNQQPYYKQFIILIAGSVCNFLFAFLLYWGVYSYGVIYPLPIIGFVTPNSIAANSGLTPLQKITEIDQQKVEDWQQVIFALLLKYGTAKSLHLTVEDVKTHQTAHQTLTLTHWRLDVLHPDLLRSLGILPLSRKDKTWSSQFLQTKQYPFYHAWLPAISQTASVIQLNAVVLMKLLTGILSVKIISGPLGILEAAIFVSKQGLVLYLLFLAFMSTSIGFLNLLPWPGLDGGRIFFLIMECLTRRRLSYAWEALFTRLGLIFLFVFIAQTVINDLLRML